MNAREFLEEIRKARLTGNEFLELLGNSRISNAAYNEIRDDRKLSLSRLTEILENSTLIDRDYDNILAAAFELADQKAGRSAVYHGADLRGTLRGDGVSNRHNYAANTPNKSAEPDIEAESLKLRQSLQKPVQAGSPISAVSVTPKLPAYPQYDDDDDYDSEEAEGDSAVSETSRRYGIYESYEDYEDDRTNTFKIIFSLICGIALMAAVLVMNIQTTGSIFPPEKPETEPFTQPQSYAELSAAIADLPVWYPEERSSDGGEGRATRYYLDTAAVPPAISDFAQWQNRAFTLYDGVLTAYELTEGGALRMATYAAENAFGITVFGDKLYLFGESSYTASYLDYPDMSQSDGSESDGGVGGEADEDFPNDGVYTMNEVSVTVFDADSFRLLSSTAMDGDLRQIIFDDESGQVAILTDYRPVNNAAIAARYPRAYTPTVVMEGERELLETKRIFLPEGVKFANYSLICRVEGANEGIPHISGVIGGMGDSELSFGEGVFCLIQHEIEDSRLMSWSALDFAGIKQSDFPDEKLIAAEYADSPESGSDGAFRAAAEHTLYLLDSDLQQIALVTDIAADDSVKTVLFSEKQAYYIGGSLYVFDLSIPSEPLPVTNADSRVYSDEYMRYGDNGRISVTQNGGSSLRITVYSAANGGIEPQNAVDINDPGMIVLNSPATDNPGALWRDSAAGLIALPIEYHDGVSQVAEFRLYDYMSHGGFSLRDSAVFYDVDCGYLRCCVENNRLYMFRADGVTAAVIGVAGLDVME